MVALCSYQKETGAQITIIVKPLMEQIKENLETEIEPFLIELVKKLQQHAAAYCSRYAVYSISVTLNGAFTVAP